MWKSFRSIRLKSCAARKLELEKKDNSRLEPVMVTGGADHIKYNLKIQNTIILKAHNRLKAKVELVLKERQFGSQMQFTTYLQCRK